MVKKKYVVALWMSGLLAMSYGVSVLAAEPVSDNLFVLEEEELVIVEEEDTDDVENGETEESSIGERIQECSEQLNQSSRVVKIEDELPEESEEPEIIADMVANGQAITVSTNNNITLTADATVPSVTMTGGTLDLAGYTLTVTGDVTQSGGTIELDRGTMNVEGDFIQREGYDSLLWMQYSNDRLNVNGNYTTGASRSHWGYLTDGIMTIGGDLIVGSGNEYNFSTSGKHRLVFTGSNSHLISFSRNDSKGIISNLQVDSGKIQVKDFLAVGYLQNDLDITSVEGDTLYTDEFNLNGHAVTLDGNLYLYGDFAQLDLDGGNLTINGNFYQQGGGVGINKGTMTVKGNYEQKEGYASLLRMEYSNDRLNINGNYITGSSRDHRGFLTDGIMDIGGDLIVGSGDKYNFSTSGKHRLVFTGSNSHLISFSRNDSAGTIRNLQVDSGKIQVKDFLAVGYFQNDLNITSIEGGTLYTDEFNLNGHTVVLDGNLYLNRAKDFHASTNLDLAEGNLTINGNFYQQGGQVGINKGTMTVKGNYEQREGYASSLLMEYSNDRLNVDGNFATYSTTNSLGDLKNGIMTIKGNFIQGAGSEYNFCATGSHLVKLTGDNVQNVSFSTYPKSHFNRLYVSKPLATGYVFSANPCWNKISGHIYTYIGFDDVPSAEGNWKHDNIKYVYEYGVMNGISGTNNFNPDDKLTRAMFATVLYRMAGEPDVNFRNQFTDVKSGQYYSNAVIWAYEKGIVSGFGDGSYGVNSNITREQIAKMLYEFGKSQGYDMSLSASLNTFSDTSEVSGWAIGYMQWAVGTRMISGKPKDNGTYELDPKGDATRAECAKMLSMFMQKYAE